MAAGGTSCPGRSVSVGQTKLEILRVSGEDNGICSRDSPTWRSWCPLRRHAAWLAPGRSWVVWRHGALRRLERRAERRDTRKIREAQSNTGFLLFPLGAYRAVPPCAIQERGYTGTRPASAVALRDQASAMRARTRFSRYYLEHIDVVSPEERNIYLQLGPQTKGPPPDLPTAM